MFAGEGDPFRTNRRFHCCRPTPRRPAVDGVRLGHPLRSRPDERPGRLRQGRHLSGVSVDDLNDMKLPQDDGFDLDRPGPLIGVDDDHPVPAPTILAFWPSTRSSTRRRSAFVPGRVGPADAEAEEIRVRDAGRTSAARCRPTSSKEDQGRTPASSPPSSACGDDGRHPAVVHRKGVRNSIRCRSPAITSPRPGRTRSASPLSRSPTVSPTSSTYLGRGMDIDDFAPNLSFFFSNGMDPSTPVIGRVARRIWAGDEGKYGQRRSWKLKYHVQTSGRFAARPGDGVQRHPHHAAGAHRITTTQQPPTPTFLTRP